MSSTVDQFSEVFSLCFFALGSVSRKKIQGLGCRSLKKVENHWFKQLILQPLVFIKVQNLIKSTVYQTTVIKN
jgi:hypothetical protein